MKKNDKKLILDYFADLMNPAEKSEFESRLQSDTELAKLFHSFRDHLDEITKLNNIEIADNLSIPSINYIHSKAAVRYASPGFVRLAYTVTVIFLAVIAFIFTQELNRQSPGRMLGNYADLTENISSEINDSYTDHFAFDDITEYSEFYQNIDLSENYLDSIINDNSTSVFNSFDEFVTSDYSKYIAELNSDEFNELYEFLKVK